VTPVRLGRASFDLRYDASVDGSPVCVGTVTYVSVKPGTAESCPIPDDVRAAMEAAVDR
jgi:acyl-CoA thioesterase FadM